MSLNLNKIILAGRLVADPEQKQTQSGTAVTTFRLAVNRRFPSQNGQSEADFFHATAFGKTAEFIVKYFTKGMAICICGRIENRSWTDQSGQKRTADEIIAEEANFVEGKGADGIAPAATSYPAASAPAYSAPNTPNFQQINTDDDLPF